MTSDMCSRNQKTLGTGQRWACSCNTRVSDAMCKADHFWTPLIVPQLLPRLHCVEEVHELPAASRLHTIEYAELANTGKSRLPCAGRASQRLRRGGARVRAVSVVCAASVSQALAAANTGDSRVQNSRQGPLRARSAVHLTARHHVAL